MIGITQDDLKSQFAPTSFLARDGIKTSIARLPAFESHICGASHKYVFNLFFFC